MGYASAAKFQNFHDAAKGGNALALKVTVNTAGRIVEDMSKKPDGTDAEELADYVARATDGELMIARYLWETQGFVSSSGSIVGSSVSYQSDPAIVDMIRTAMGSFAKTEAESLAPPGGATAYVGRAGF